MVTKLLFFLDPTGKLNELLFQEGSNGNAGGAKSTFLSLKWIPYGGFSQKLVQPSNLPLQTSLLRRF